MITIREYNDSDQNDWDEYVMRHPDSTLFHLQAWRQAIEKTFGHKSMCLVARKYSDIQYRKDSVIAKNQTISNISKNQYYLNDHNHSDGKIVGILPVFQIKSFLFGNYLVSIPFAELGGIVADNENIAQNLLSRAIELAEGINCDYLELRNRKPIFDLPVKSLYYNFRREIYPDLDQNLEAIPRKARRMVRQGIKYELTSEFGNHLLNQFYDILARSFHGLGTPVFPLKHFKNLLENFGENIKILLIRNKDKTPIAGVLSFVFKDQILPYYAGSHFKFRRLAPNDFMYWELMRYGCENGCKIFDFGRSKKDTGSYQFKRHWGFEPTRLAYQYHLIRSKEIPNISPANPKYQKKIELWQKLPFFLTKIIGPPIARYLT